MTYEVRRTQYGFNRNGQLTGDFPVNPYNYSVSGKPGEIEEIVEFNNMGEFHEFTRNGSHEAIKKKLGLK